MTAYEGGENIYDIDGEPIRVSWLTTQDGLAWTPVVPEVPFVLEGGASETDFELLDDGSLVAVSRNEAGDALGWGSKVCTAPADDLGAWSCAPDPRKYDSPLLFQHEGQVWLIARRHLTDTGHYDLGSDEPDLAKRTRDYLIAYSTTPKRCALWKVDPAQKKVEFVLDLPSRGDTCFASALPEPDGSYWIYNYTSDPSGPELTWAEGQVRPTLIYRVRLRLP
jgi:hypothetical protein